MRIVNSAMLSVALCLAACQGLAAAEFNITVEARVSGRRLTAVSGRDAPSALLVKRGETLSVQWTAVNPASAAVLSDVTLHATLDRDAASGAREAPKQGSSGAIYEGAVNLDFRPGERSTGTFRMPMSAPGSYVLRVETVAIRARAGGETFASMKVTVQ